MKKMKHSSYRQRVYQLADKSIQLVYEDAPAPENALLLADQDVVSYTEVSPHVEPEQAVKE